MHALVLDALLTSFQTISTFSFMYLGYITLVTIEISISWFIMWNAPFHVYLTGRTCCYLRGALVLYRYLSHRLLEFSVMLTRCGHFIPSLTAADLYSANTPMECVITRTTHFNHLPSLALLCTVPRSSIRPSSSGRFVELQSGVFCDIFDTKKMRYLQQSGVS